MVKLDIRELATLITIARLERPEHISQLLDKLPKEKRYLGEAIASNNFACLNAQEIYLCHRIMEWQW